MDIFRASIEELAGDVNRQIERVRETYGKLGDVESTAHSADGMISVTVGANGQVRDIQRDLAWNPGLVHAREETAAREGLQARAAP
ncbi:YbaB/EbfC family nucleoid-associated protein [Nonomuraea sp. NPDC046802]|uniref:YbaB/EbfC family nucleoid-associated protein n=1 Tax=Nonomuraea sp. NPDC046802 TaxID=3154919 RepID=UPI0033E36292